jgi:hypothetical protein
MMLNVGMRRALLYKKSANWWLAGGISPSNCVLAYQPKGAADYTASKVNLAKPGVYNAVEGVAPAWTAAGGWDFDGVDDYLNSQYTPASGNITIMMRFANAYLPAVDYRATGYETGSGQRMAIFPNRYTTRAYVNGAWNSRREVAGGALASGNMCFAGLNCYLNGVSDGSISGSVASGYLPIYIGCMRVQTLPSGYANLDVVAYAIYNVVLDASQVLALNNAMAAL